MLASAMKTAALIFVLLFGANIAHAQTSTVIVDPITGQRANIDDISGAFITITYAHHEIHEGDAFITDFTIPGTSGGASEYFGIGFTTPSAEVVRIHIIVSMETAASAHLELIESPTTLTGGTNLTAYNRARFSTSTTKLQGLTSYDSTGSGVITGGTIVYDLYTWSSKQSGGGSREVSEFILKPETTYAYKITFDAGSNGGQMILEWYEHQDSDN